MNRPESTQFSGGNNSPGATQPRRGNGVLEHHRDRHRPDAARHRRDVRGRSAAPGSTSPSSFLLSGTRFIPTSTTVAPALTMSAVDEVRAADGGDEDVGVERVPREVLRARVADRHGRVALEEEMRHRLADDRRAADHDGARALERDLVLVEHPHDAERRARDERRPAEVEAAGVDRVDPVDVLLRRDRLDDPVLVEVVRQRELDEEPVDRVVGVERRDRREHVLLGRVRRELDVARLHARRGRGLLLQVDVDVRGGVVADEDRSRARRGRPRRPKRRLPRALSRRAPCRRGGSQPRPSAYSENARGGTASPQERPRLDPRAPGGARACPRPTSRRGRRRPSR